MAFQLPKVTRKKRLLGRGHGKGGGKSGRGQKGQRSRAGYSSKAGFEGGQTPLYMRFPKGRGVKQINPSQIVKPIAITIATVASFAPGSIVGPGQLQKAGHVARKDSVKLIGSGKIEGSYTVRVHHATKNAIASIEKAGGKVEIINV
ncbi:MAG: 50S ribosomal protein L15 [Candidatus Andersenbacteria bacterium RIFCSPHIGHO2_02_FULL_45_11]|uniref:Large ribosomal subunit protein uL15 n=1 Tax=Candidatus Andersenbacteria bacterium RIFCSPHIGHO2_12_FULL_45_11 TaxID=1797281 RepID=A0A1G1X2Y3_9BACT|nr:MAG: 50S ribosomal protein L15 [Candidatus Andersenbacteria bacterium RIFCSPHIGHO2_01_FULL_46_36]OGY34372.1 MAG: 50S ribosomal protein L15 [Candidatus Andersenbacteria bacterium RIFCSPHIGHO2_12_FULL_45_11]OGY34951.1 MAG: 50S ribosomal protein L15 [Candidatus Andersenbacteria bacterium RIFCSPHIGHO2_02_FULL_45_11]